MVNMWVLFTPSLFSLQLDSRTQMELDWSGANQTGHCSTNYWINLWLCLLWAPHLPCYDTVGLLCQLWSLIVWLCTVRVQDTSLPIGQMNSTNCTNSESGFGIHKLTLAGNWHKRVHDMVIRTMCILGHRCLLGRLTWVKSRLLPSNAYLKL